MPTTRSTGLKRNDERVILHFDYDCFYASVFEVENPVLRDLPLAVQQKHIIVTCNYEARRRGLYKLQLITEAKRICPDVVILLGEDLTRFRDASKELHDYLKDFIWSGRVEKLGLDELFLDVTSMIEFNMEVLNINDLKNSFFYLSRSELTDGFPFDASHICGETYPACSTGTISTSSPLTSCQSNLYNLETRLMLGAHLAQYLRHKLRDEKGYTSAVGISTSKLLSKLVGNVNKPNNQTVLLPPYTALAPDEESNVTSFLDSHKVNKIPGVGYKIAQKLRSYCQAAPVETGLEVNEGSRKMVYVREVRCYPEMGSGLLDRLLRGPGVSQGIGKTVWNLINGIDDTPVGLAKIVPQQISIEDSYRVGDLDSLVRVEEELLMLCKSLLKRMQKDLVEIEDLSESQDITDATWKPAYRLSSDKTKRWIAHARTLRLSTRPSVMSDGSSSRAFSRISQSRPMPGFIFNLEAPVDALAERLVKEALLPEFRKLHPQSAGWNLTLLNVAATNIETVGGGSKGQRGVIRDISRMLRTQEDLLRPWRVEDQSTMLHVEQSHSSDSRTSDELDDQVKESRWEMDDDDGGDEDNIGRQCERCGATVLPFAEAAHSRFHLLES